MSDYYVTPTKITTGKYTGTPVDPRLEYYHSKVASNTKLVALLSRFGGNKSLSSSQAVLEKLDKYIKQQKKMMKAQEEVIKELRIWTDLIPNDQSKAILVQLSNCFQLKRELEEANVQKEESLKIQLSNVQKREQKANDLKNKRNKLYKDLRLQESKFGESASTALTKEHLEELNVSVEVVQDQYTRSVNTNLKRNTVELMMALSMNASKLKSGVDNFFLSIPHASIEATDNLNNHNANSSGELFPLMGKQPSTRSPSKGAIEYSNSRCTTPLSSKPSSYPKKHHSTNYTKILHNQQAELESRKSLDRSPCVFCQHLGTNCNHNSLNLDFAKFSENLQSNNAYKVPRHKRAGKLAGVSSDVQTPDRENAAPKDLDFRNITKFSQDPWNDR